jgi:hypothetical protein
MKTKRTKATKIRDLLLYVLISVVICVTFLFGALSGIPNELFMKGVGFFLATVFVYGFVIERFRRYWKFRQFWILAGAAFLLHCIGFSCFMLYAGKTAGRDFAFFAVVEIAVLSEFMDDLLSRGRRKRPYER